MSSIYYEKGRKKYRAAFITPGGKRITKRFDTREDAQDWADANRIAVRKGEFTEPTKMTLGQWLAFYIKTYKGNVRDATYNNYLYRASLMAPIANLPLQADNSVQIQQFFNSFPLGASTAKLVLGLGSMAMQKAVELGVVRRNYFNGIVTERVPHEPVEVFTVEEIRAIEKACDKSAIGPMVILMIYTGIRIGEAMALQWGDYDGEYIHIRRTVSNKRIAALPKTDSSIRDIILPERVTKMLNQMRHGPSRSLMFPTKSGRLRAYSIAWHAWELLLQNAGVPYRSFHALRHTHASQLLASGTPITEVSRRLGHRNSGTTLNVYSHAIKGNDKKVASALETLFCSQNAPNAHYHLPNKKRERR